MKDQRLNLNLQTAYQITQQLNKRTCIICATDKDAKQLCAQLQLLIGGEKKIAYLPSPQTLLYEAIEPSPSIVAQRLHTLYEWQANLIDCIVMSVTTYARALPSPDFIGKHCLKFCSGDKIDPIELRKILTNWHYEYADFVCDPGTFAMRGAIIDIYPFHAEHALRLELFDTEIEQIYELGDNQPAKIEQINIFPDTEYELNSVTIANFQKNWQAQFGLWGQKSEVFQRTQKQKIYAGIHQWLHMLYPDSGYWHNFNQAQTTFISENIFTEYEKQYSWAQKHYLNHNANAAMPILPTSKIMLEPEQLKKELSQYQTLAQSSTISAKPRAKLTIFPSQHEAKASALAQNGQYLEQQNMLAAWLQDEQQTGNFMLASSVNIEPCVVNGVLIKNELKPIQNKTSKTEISQNHNLTIGSYVVHPKYGIGKLAGISTITHDGESYDCVVIEYANSGKIFVPMTELAQLAKFKEVQEGSNVVLSTLGKKSWQHKQAKVIHKIIDDAAALLQLHAKRKQQVRPKYTINSDDFAEFLERFPFSDTADQAKITQTLIEDLTKKTYPMERLICGDVGFGKTELALRATWIVVSSGKQAAWLAPTTILAKQHANRLRERFEPDCFAILECFGGKTLSKEQLDDLRAGKYDVIVGTHAILGKTIAFAELGLVVIDEEHKFGVKQKDLLSSKYPMVDMLNLSATPIPRSLNMAMSSLRDISLLASPPIERLDIKTFTGNIDDQNLMQQAIMRELQRGGQVYFCYNRIEKLDDKKQELQVLFPEAIINIVHGQMAREQINRQMQDFALQTTDILLCSSIVESGLDYANANTLIVYRADLFGLSQLHQLRGRVGRGKQQAYAYFLVPDMAHQSKDCQARIAAIKHNSTLGSGFALAIEDLEIRGAGNLLGKQQSGHIMDMGFEHYIKLLKQTMHMLEHHPGEELNIDTILSTNEFTYNLPYSTIIPSDYITEPNVRLLCYQELAQCQSHTEIAQLAQTWQKRYGPYPKATANLIEMAHIKLDLLEFGASSLVFNADKHIVIVGFTEQALTEQQIQTILTKPECYQIKPPAQLICTNANNLRTVVAKLCNDLSI